MRCAAPGTETPTAFGSMIDEAAMTALRFLISLAPWLAAAVLAGCAHPGFVEPRPVPPERVAALVRAAIGEWERWGRQDVRIPAGDEYCAELPGDRCLTIDSGCGKEQDTLLCTVVNEYWGAVNRGDPAAPRHWCTQVQHCEAHWDPAWGEPDDTPPWSAAFISALMQRAGFDESEFAFSDTHAVYVVAARDHRTSAYELVPTPATASIGDLVCATRQVLASDVPPTDVRALRTGEHATPMHCDLVVAVDAVAHRLDAIGGNVEQSVARSRITLDDEQRVSAALNPARPWIAVMRLVRPAAR
jgi:hypothetical protein